MNPWLNYALIDPKVRSVSNKRMRLHNKHQSLRALSVRHGIRTWDFAGYVPCSSTNRYLAIFVDDGGWLHSGDHYCFLPVCNIPNATPLSGVAVCLPLQAGDMNADGTTVAKDDDAPITQDDLKSIHDVCLWLGNKPSLLAAYDHAYVLLSTLSRPQGNA